MANSLACVANVALLLSICVSSTLACSGYSLSVNKIDVCKDVDSVVSLQNLSVSLSNDCRIIPTGCISTRPFTTAMVHYKLYKVDSLLRFEGDIDGCKAIENVPEEIQAILEAVTAFAKCPAKQAQICDDASTIVDISKYSKYLSMAEGRIRGELKVNHGAEKTCIKFDININKKGSVAAKGKTDKNIKKFSKKYGG